MSQEEKENLIEEAKFNYYYKNGKRGEKDIYNFNQLPNTSVVKIGLLRIEGKNFLYVNTDDSELFLPKKLIKPLESTKANKSGRIAVITSNDDEKDYNLVSLLEQLEVSKK
ncbi:8801_t:CDS:2, partial [Funneliformis geosporum]